MAWNRNNFSNTPRIRRTTRALSEPRSGRVACPPKARRRREGPLSVPPRGTGFIALRTHLHKSLSASPSFSYSCKRVRISLKLRNFKSLSFHTHAHSFAVSPLFATHTQNIPGVCVPPMLQSRLPEPLLDSTPLLSLTSALFRDPETQSVQPLCFQLIPHSFALFSCKSFVCLTYAKQRGVYTLSRFPKPRVLLELEQLSPVPSNTCHDETAASRRPSLPAANSPKFAVNEHPATQSRRGDGKVKLQKGISPALSRTERNFGAGDGNRTHVRSLGSFYTAIVRRPPRHIEARSIPRLPPSAAVRNGMQSAEFRGSAHAQAGEQRNCRSRVWSFQGRRGTRTVTRLRQGFGEARE